MKLQEIRKAIYNNFWDKVDQRDKLHRLTDEIEILVTSYSLPGVAPRWEEVNPNIRYFDCVFMFANEYPELLERIKKGTFHHSDSINVGFRFYPTEVECKKQQAYFEKQKARCKEIG